MFLLLIALDPCTEDKKCKQKHQTCKEIKGSLLCDCMDGFISKTDHCKGKLTFKLENGEKHFIDFYVKMFPQVKSTLVIAPLFNCTLRAHNSKAQIRRSIMN